MLAVAPIGKKGNKATSSNMSASNGGAPLNDTTALNSLNNDDFAITGYENNFEQ